MILFVVGPAYQAFLKGSTDSDAQHLAAMHAWHIGICAIVVSGLFKLVCAVGSGWVRRVIPRAGLLGSLAAIALVFISFLPLLDILHYPVVGMAALAVILTTLVARVDLPFKIPGALGALLVGCGVYYVMNGFGWLTPEPATFQPENGLWPHEWLSVFSFEWVRAFPATLPYLPIVIPFALATVVGGIDCTESAAAVGDEYPTGKIIAVEGIATLIAGCCGGVIQTTPYIGHPAYKAMGGRALYTLATALFVGSAGLLGYFGFLYILIPKAAIFPILIFIGLEITAQSFHATPQKHYAAVAFACIPAMASLVLIFTDNLLAQSGKSLDELFGQLPEQLQTLRILSGGFIVTSLLWASGLAALIDRNLRRAALFFAIAAVCSLFGVIHSPLPGNPLVVPWNLPASLPHAAAGQTPVYLAAGYGIMALILFVWSLGRGRDEKANVEKG